MLYRSGINALPHSDIAMRSDQPVIALESRLRNCTNVLTLGVRPNFSAYNPLEQQQILSAATLYYPTRHYAEHFETLGKPIFPSSQTYSSAQDNIKQTTASSVARIPHPRTRFFYGKRQKASILEYFSFPFVAKVPRGSAMGRGVFLITCQTELDDYLSLDCVAYIQEYLPSNKDVRVVIIGDRIIHAYWRISSGSDFRCNISVGGKVSLDPVPEAALTLALDTSKKLNWNDVGIDLICHDQNWYVIEANMKYGKEGFRQAGIDYYELMEGLIQNGDI